MDVEECMDSLINNRSLGIYDLIKKLSQKYAEKLPQSIQENISKKLVHKSYEILLNKSQSNFIAVPNDYTDEDLLNELYLQLCQYKNDERINKFLNKFKRLYELQNTNIYKNSFAPVIKMIFSITINQPDSSKKKKCSNIKEIGKDWFDVGSIPKTLQSLKHFLKPKEDIKFFTLPKIPSSQSEGNLSIFCRSTGLPPSLTFDSFLKKMNSEMKMDKLSYDLDEGFVTPSEEHKEKTPSMELCSSSEVKAFKKFDWDWEVLSIPPSKHKRWEKFDLLGRGPEHPFVCGQIKYQHFLYKAPQIYIKISRKQLLEDMMSLLIGISSETFIYNGEHFRLQSGICTENHTIEDVIDMTKTFIEAGEAFIFLNMLSKKKSDDDTITRAFKLALKEYLYNHHKTVNEKINEMEDSEKYITDVELFIEQVIFLKKLLSQFEDMKGFTLLNKLYSNMENSPDQMFYTLCPLFLYPCVYYFRLIDDWIFLGKWHKDLPIMPCDMNLVQDRLSWEDAHRPIQTDCLWFLPVQDLADCGKALSLLSLSKNSEVFLNMLRSGNRPEVKLCLNLNELKELEEECKAYYQKSKNTFHSEKEKLLDLVTCAQNSAKLRAEAFRETIEEKQVHILQRKKKELLLREEDLLRSAKVKELKKLEEDLDNMRVAKEVEELLVKEKQIEIEKGKEIFRILKEEEIKEEKFNLRANWKLKRLQNKEKLKLLIRDEKNLLEGEENFGKMAETEELETHPTEESFSKIPKMMNKFDENLIKYSELQRNRSKMLASTLGVGDSTATYLMEMKNDQNNPAMEIVKKENVTKHSSDKSNKESSFAHENEKSNFHCVSQNEAENNKKKMLGSHFSLGADFRIENKNDVLISSAHEEIYKETIGQHNVDNLTEVIEPNMSQNVCPSEEIRNEETEGGAGITSELNLSVITEKQVFLEETNKIDDQPETATQQALHIGLNGVNWFHNCYKHNERLKNLYKANYKVVLPDQSLDYYSLMKGVPGSLKIVIDTQVKLMNEALLKMFLGEFGLLIEAGKLKKLFFLEGEYGKRLTSSLCEAIEREKPSTFLTFGKLRDILASASQGEEKVSFIVKETPVAFEHTNPQTLNCLGLSYKFEWPLNIIFTDKAISKYNEVFDYVLALHRVTWHLEKVWLALKFKSSQIKGPEYTQIQLYRHVMYQFVCTLRSHISTSVFENSWQKFSKDVSEVTRFSDLYRRHANYIKEIIFKCFLYEKSFVIMQKIKSLLRYVLIFCQTMRFGEWSVSKNGNYEHSKFTKLQNTFSCFLKFARYVIQQIEKLVKVNYQEGLDNLYNAFTINSFYLKTKI